MPIPTAPAQTPRPLLRDQVHDRLLEAIVDGELEPGQALSDKDLETWLGASRTPIREALNRLANTGLVEVLPQKATRVALVDPKQFAQITEVLGALYAAAVTEAVPLLTDGDVTVLRGFEKRVLADGARAKEAAQISVPQEIFHVFLARYGNRLLLHLPEKFTPHIQRTLNVFHDSIDAKAGFPALRELIDAAADRDAARASAAVTDYFTGAVAAFNEAIVIAAGTTPGTTSATASATSTASATTTTTTEEAAR